MRYFFKIILIIAIVIFFAMIIIQAYGKKSKTAKKKSVPSPTITPTSTPVPATPTESPSVINTIIRKSIFVKPDGDDAKDGQSEQTAFRTIQKAVDVAQPGDIIQLSAGFYMQNVITKRGGLPNSPITITGPRSAIVKGGSNPRVIEINHSSIVLDGFTVDGLHGTSTSKSGYKDKLIYAIGTLPGKGVTNLKILNMEIKNAGGECIRLRYFAQYNEIANNTITNCGVYNFVFNEGGKSGEGIYIGTAPEQRDDKRNPTTDVDQSNNNWVHGNMITTYGNECVDIKEGSGYNIIEYNRCSGQKDPDSGGMDSRGNNNTFRYNEIFGNAGAGVRLGGDDKKSDGINNSVYGNTIRNNAAGGIKFQRSPQGAVCGNTMEDNAKGNSVGSYGEDFNPEKPCE